MTSILSIAMMRSGIGASCARSATSASSSVRATAAAASASYCSNNNFLAIRSKSTAPKKSEASDHALQDQLWQKYLATTRGAAELFKAIDRDADAKVSIGDIKFFLESVQNRNGVRKDAFDDLEHLAQDHELDLTEFRRWLVGSTKLEPQSWTSHKEAYEAKTAIVGQRRPQEEAKEGEVVKEYAWNEGSMAQSLRKMQYAVRGEVVMKAESLMAEGKEIIFTNIGNPQAVGQKPITYYRQVLALCDLPAECGVDHPDAPKVFPADVLERAKELRAAIGPAGSGAYTHSQGVALFRQHVADFIAERDGHPAYPGDIFLTNGASTAIQDCLTALIACDRDAIMIPIPQYPIYSALIALLGGHQAGYYLDESKGWAVTAEDLENTLAVSEAKGHKVKAMAMINPGNPSGALFDRESLETICKFCAKNGIVLLADEVYQRNVYVDDKKFVSAKKVACETPGCENLELVSFHSTSKGLIGECGRRGGYMELHNIDPYVHAQLYKLVSSGLCSSVDGQIMTSLMVRGPKPGDASYDRFMQEEGGIFNSLVRRSAALVEGLNKIDGITCERAEGAMYAFPAIELPPTALEAAKAAKQSPDTLYAVSLLEETGICVVPASGFGQKEGRIGFRTTFLPPEEKIGEVVDGFAKHHKTFCERYA